MLCLLQFNSIYNFVFINGNSNDLKKLLIYLKGTVILAFGHNLSGPAISGLTSAPTLLAVIPFKKFDWYLNEDELLAVISANLLLSLGYSGLLYWYKDAVVSA